MVVFLESDIEDLMRRLDAPVSSNQGHPLHGRESIRGEAGDEVAVFMGNEVASGVEGLRLDAEDRTEMRSAFGLLCGRTDVEDVEASHDLLAAIGVVGAGIRLSRSARAEPKFGCSMERWLCALQPEEIMQILFADGVGVVERRR